MSDGYVSEAAEAIDRLARAVETLAGAVCLHAAGEHTDNLPDQRDQGEAFYAYARSEFAELTRKMDPKRQAQFDSFIQSLCKRR